MRFAIHALTRGLAILVAVVLAAPGIAAAAQATTSEPVGSSTIAFTSDWLYADGSTSDIAYLVYQGAGQAPGPESDYFYLELDNSTLAVLDNQYVTEAVVMANLRETFQTGITPLIAQGDLSAPTLWTLYSVSTADGPTLLLMVDNVSLIPGRTAVAWVMASPQNFAQVVQAAQQEITIGGQPNVMALVDANPILAAAASSQATTPAQQPAQQQPTQQPAQQQPAQQQPAAPTPAAGAASVPPSSAGQAGMVLVGNDTVTYGTGWQYIPSESDDSGAVFQFRTNPQVVYIYYFSADNGGVDAATALQQFDQSFYSDFDPSTVQELTAETLTSGVAWSLHRVDAAGNSTVYLTTVNVSPQGTRYQVLSAPIDQFASSLPAVQQGFAINDTGAFVNIDAADVESFIGAAPVAAQTPQAGVAGATDYAALDAPSGCDGIGWVITDPSQMPATQADLDYRSACVGGATYAAACGSYAAADTGTMVECEVNVAVGPAPMAVSSRQFTLVDASGNAYPVDMNTTITMEALLGGPELPEGTVAAGTTASGLVFFTVPTTAAKPWTIQVAPDTIATTGEQPGVLVIDGLLEPFDVFGQ